MIVSAFAKTLGPPNLREAGRMVRVHLRDLESDRARRAPTQPPSGPCCSWQTLSSQSVENHDRLGVKYALMLQLDMQNRFGTNQALSFVLWSVHTCQAALSRNEATVASMACGVGTGEHDKASAETLNERPMLRPQLCVRS